MTPKYVFRGLLALAAVLLVLAVATGVSAQGRANTTTGIIYLRSMMSNLLFSPDATYDIGAAGATRPRNLFLSGSAVIGGNISASNLLPGTTIAQLSPTGVTPNGNSYPAPRVFSVSTSVDRTAFICNATTCDVNLFTLPAKTTIMHAVADLTTTFACASTCTTATLSETLGKSAGGTELLLSFDADAATGQFGLTQATLGTLLAPLSATVPNAGVVGTVASWSGTTTVSIRLTSGTGAVGTGAATNLSQGVVVIYLTLLVYA